MAQETASISETLQESLSSAITTGSEYLTPEQQVTLYKILSGLLKLHIPPIGRNEKRAKQKPFIPLSLTKQPYPLEDMFTIGSATQDGNEIRWLLLAESQIALGDEEHIEFAYLKPGMAIETKDDTIISIRLTLGLTPEKGSISKNVLSLSFSSAKGKWVSSDTLISLNIPTIIEAFSFLAEI